MRIYFPFFFLVAVWCWPHLSFKICCWYPVDSPVVEIMVLFILFIFLKLTKWVLKEYLWDLIFFLFTVTLHNNLFLKHSFEVLMNLTVYGAVKGRAVLYCSYVYSCTVCLRSQVNIIFSKGINSCFQKFQRNIIGSMNNKTNREFTL